jgi:DNA-binding winged helix-turn-helix (wHTH) protein
LVYRFGDFTLDPATRQLLCNGAEAHLTPKAYDLLVRLVAGRDRAVSKEELQQCLWPSTFVEETNLATLVAEIRRTLRDSAANPTFVRTVYGFGYRFVAEPVEEIAARAAGQARVKLWLTVERRQIPLLERTNVIGRAEDVAIRVDATGVSRYHARILVAGDSATLEDLGSKNGSYVNGMRVITRLLSNGDEIRLGATVLTFRTASEAAPTETLPPQQLKP